MALFDPIYVSVVEPIKDFLQRTIFTPPRRERFAYFRAVPPRRMALLSLAVFCLFASMGLISTLTGDKATDLFRGFVSAFLTGVMGSVYIVVSTRKPRFFPLALLVQLLFVHYLPGLLAASGVVWHAASYMAAVKLYAGISSIFAGLAYFLFFFFIQTEGRYAFRAQTELALAHSIQATLVPVIDVVIAGCEVYGISVPSEKVGGDLVDLVALPDGSAVAYVADIAGHGLQAGILMGMVKSAARTSLLNLPSPNGMFQSLNRVLPGVKESNMYATCAALHLRPMPGLGCEVEYALAGHPAILHLAASGEAGPQLSDQQLPLGILPQAEYRSHSILAAPGDLLIATTDGILEVAGKNGVEFGAEGLERLLKASTDLPLAAIAEQILSAARRIGPQDDDRTLLLIRVL